MPLVTFIKQELTIEVAKGSNLREVALENRVDLYRSLDLTHLPECRFLQNCSIVGAGVFVGRVG